MEQLADKVDTLKSVEISPPDGRSVVMHRYLKEHVGAFDPHEIRTLVSALEKAWESIQAP